MIRQLDDDSAGLLGAAQAIGDLSSAIKELVENALDANAQCVTVSLINHGLHGFSVVDDGLGMSLQDLEHTAIKGFTSKIRSDNDIFTVSTYGFRGEALHAISRLSESMRISSRPSKDPSSLTHDVSNHSGHALFFENGTRKIEPVAHAVGTCVSISNFLSAFPVRRADWERNMEKHYSKTVALVQMFALAQPEVRFRLLHQKKSSDNSSQPTVVFASSGTGDPVNVYVEAFGNSTQSSSLPRLRKSSAINWQCEENSQAVNTTICIYHSVRSVRKTKDRQFVFLRGRPVEMPSLMKRLNDVWRLASGNRQEMAQSPMDQFKVNRNSISIYPSLLIYIDDIVSDTSTKALVDVNFTPDKRVVAMHQEEQLYSAIVSLFQESLAEQSMIKCVAASELRPTSTQSTLPFSLAETTPLSVVASSQIINDAESLSLDTGTISLDSSGSSQMHSSGSSQMHSSGSSQANINDSNSTDQSCINCNSIDTDMAPSLFQESVAMSQSDFARMTVLGQFNCGFILASLVIDEQSSASDSQLSSMVERVFIIDQHASDERYRLETLIKKLTCSSQKLFKPILLNDRLDVDQLLYVMDHLSVLSQHGFVVAVQTSVSSDTNNNSDSNTTDNPLCYLTHVPVPKDINMNDSLDIEDFIEAIHLMQQNLFENVSSLKKVARCLASRACRSAIMIGETLCMQQMQQVVLNLTNLRFPWICAHGRPTVRLLYEHRF